MIDLESYLTKFGFVKEPRLDIWNAIDDCPSLSWSRFNFKTKDNTICKISMAIQKPGTKWPEHQCLGDNYKNKFCVYLEIPKDVNGFRTFRSAFSPCTSFLWTGFVEINNENIEKYIVPLIKKRLIETKHLE